MRSGFVGLTSRPSPAIEIFGKISNQQFSPVFRTKPAKPADCCRRAFLKDGQVAKTLTHVGHRCRPFVRWFRAARPSASPAWSRVRSGQEKRSSVAKVQKVVTDCTACSVSLNDEQISQIQSRGNHRERTRKLGPNRAFDCSDPTGLVPALISKKEWSRVRCCGDTGHRRLNRTIATQ